MEPVKLLKHPDDPICLRASCGGNSTIGYYCIFRGKRTEIVECLEHVLKALKSDQQEMKNQKILMLG